MRTALWILVCLGAASTAARAETVCWDNGQWWDGSGFVKKTFCGVDGVLRTKRPARVDRRVDLGGRHVVPPFGEPHHHGIDSTNGLDFKIDRFLRDGIFYVKNPNVIPDLLTAAVRAKINQPTSIDVSFSNGGLTSTGGHPGPLHASLAWSGVFPGLGPDDMENHAYFIVDSEHDLDAKWPLILAGKPDFLKTFVLFAVDKPPADTDADFSKGLSPAMLQAIVRRAHKSGLRVTSHIETASDFRVAVEAGVDEINHLPMPLGKACEETPRLCYIDEATAKLAAERHIVVIAAPVANRFHLPDEVMAKITAQTSANVKRMLGAGVRVTVGSDGISGETPMATAIGDALYVASAGIADNRATLKMITETAAATIFPNRKIGRLEDGYEASFLALEGDPLTDFKNITRISLRVKQGRTLELPTSPPPGPTEYPPLAAPVREVKDDYFGQTVIDPYRWMEDEKDPARAPWMRAQDLYTRRRIGELPGRDNLLARIRELDRGGGAIRDLKRLAGHYFYLQSEPGVEAARLFVRDGQRGAPRLLLDPSAGGPGVKPGNIDFFQPSWDGKWVGYGVSRGGSENTTIEVLEVATGRVLSDQPGQCTVCSISWLPDSQSFFYIRQRGDKPEERYSKTRAYRHTLGQKGAEDPAVFGYGISPDLEFAEFDFPFVSSTPASKYVVAMAHHGVKEEMTAWAAPLSSLGGPKTPWRKLFDVPDAVTAFDWQGDDLYVVTHRNADRYEILKTRIAAANLAKASVIVPAGESVLSDLGVTPGGLYFKWMEGGLSGVRRVARGAITEVPLPFQGAVSGQFTNPNDPGMLVQFGGWLHAPRWLAFDPQAGKTADTALAPETTDTFSAYEAIEVKARSADGTLVPLSILARRGLPLDGSHPALLEGYGSHGVAREPTYHESRLAWLERGGVLAYAHPRGGGDYGERWHRAGMKEHKGNSIDDFIACAQYLIDTKYTSAARLAIAGASAGGLLVGGAITKRPDLFGAAVSEVGVHNMLRLEAMATGPVNVPEYGSVATREGFEVLRAMDVYHQVKKGTHYPAVLLRAAMNDARVPVWQITKMAARLQAATASGAPVLLYVDSDAGHREGASASLDQVHLADVWSFLLWRLGDREFSVDQAEEPGNKVAPGER